jgi:DNA primase RepB-like protein
MSARGLELTMAAVRAHLAAVVWPHYEVRLIEAERRACRATRYWTAAQLLQADTLRFLRARNREGCEVYFRPHAGTRNAGYLLLDFDHGPCPLARLRAADQSPCVVVETSPGHQQAWLRVSRLSLPPAPATALARSLAVRYGADPASAEWRHLGRLAGFTNRKLARRQANGLPPWVRLVWQAVGTMAVTESPAAEAPTERGLRGVAAPLVTVGCAGPVYQQVLDGLHLRARFPRPDWSIADYRVARSLLRQGVGEARVADILRQGSPGFPRFHPQPEDYLRRTVQAAAASLTGGLGFSRAPAGWRK